MKPEKALKLSKKALGLKRPRIYEWLAKYREGGIDALKSQSATWRPPKLPGTALKKIYQVVVGKDPRKLKFEFALWTRGMVREYIRREFNVRLSEVYCGASVEEAWSWKPTGDLCKVLFMDQTDDPFRRFSF